jgi:hypothetical protein
MLVYTSITQSYLPKARVLASSVKRFHPNWTFVLLYSDSLPTDFDISSEPFDEVLIIDQLMIPNSPSWVFGHEIVELCTAVKGPAAEVLSKRSGVDKIMYLDPDIKVFSPLNMIDEMLDSYDILLTPHLLDPEDDVGAIFDNEISALKHGVYNLGFFAAKTCGQGMDFIKWWSKRLQLLCKADIANGVFTDQKWCDLAPAFFSKLGIVRDPGCNVATWNIAHRPISIGANGILMAGGSTLKFYHFTGYDSGAGMGMLEKYASPQEIAQEMWRQYGVELSACGQGKGAPKVWLYSRFSNGEYIYPEMRTLYHSRGDLRSAFPEPFSVDEPCFLSWWNAEVTRGNIAAPKKNSRPRLFLKKIKHVFDERILKKN